MKGRRAERTLALSRREFLLVGAALAALPGKALPLFGGARQNVRFANDPFQLGVASGDPTAGGVVLWTRLAPDPLHGGGMQPEPVEVHWEISHDEQMTKIVRK